jgi:AbrB family looped-hinge helix DNA binding protein
MAIVTISSKGWVVIPADLRRKYGLNAGAQVMVVDYGGVLTLVPAMADPIAGSAGMLRGGSSLVSALLREREQERLREE